MQTVRKLHGIVAVAALLFLSIGSLYAGDVDTLIQRLGDRDFEARLAAGDELLKLGESAVEPLAAALKSGSANQRRGAASIMGWIDAASAVDHLITALSDEDDWVRNAAAASLGLRKDARAINALKDALGDKNTSVRVSAARSMGQIGHPDAVDALAKSLGDSNYSVQIAVAAALGDIGDSSAFTPLVRMAVAGPVHRVRSAAYDAVIRLGANAVELFIAQLQDENTRQKGMAVESLEKIGDLRAVEPLIGRLKDSDAGIRAAAVKTLGAFPDERSAEPLINILNDKDSGMRATAAVSLGKIKSAQAVPHLIAYLDDDVASVRAASAWALANIADERCKEPMMSILAKRNVDAVSSAYLYYIRTGIEDAVPILIEVLEKRGDKGMADDFANCGQSRLVEAGKKWIADHGHRSNPAPGMGLVRWGQGQ